MNEVNSLWIGEELSPLQIISIKSFLKNKLKYNLYVYHDVYNIPSGVNILDGNEIINESEIFVYKRGLNKGSPSAFSNLFRYELLFQKGGLWVDTDMVLLKDFDLTKRFVFASEVDYEGNLKVATGLMYSKDKGEHLFKELIDEVNSRNKDNLNHGDIGPILFDYKVREFGLMDYVKKPEIFSYPNWSDIYKIVDGTSIHKESVCIHLWASRWQYDGMDPYKEYDKNCIYEKLKEKYL
jgi:hypothetical protein